MLQPCLLTRVREGKIIGEAGYEPPIGFWRPSHGNKVPPEAPTSIVPIHDLRHTFAVRNGRAFTGDPGFATPRATTTICCARTHSAWPLICTPPGVAGCF